MSQENRCPRCSKPLPQGSPGGLCPACLLACGLESNTAGYSEHDQARAKWTPPAIEQLAPLFPELDIMELIGRGGMGAVYKARQSKLDRLVALKILPPEIGRDPAFAQRFAREAQAMARLSHPNIVTIHDFGQRGGLYFFLMEYIDGLSLRQLLSAGGQRGRTVSPKEALAIVPQICDALQYAHDRGIVHRDIKPENILLNRAGQVKIADFGLAKLVGSGGTGESGTGFQPVQGDTSAEAGSRGAPGLTQAGEKVMGTPQYMAPEQIDRPGEVDHRADIYSLGVVFYQMLTGELPKGRPGETFEPPSRKVLIDVRLDEVVLRALEREPSRRYQQVSEVRTQVETIVATPPAGVQNLPAPEKMPQPPAGAIGTVAAPRFSRLAIVGAAWAPWASIFFLIIWYYLSAHVVVPAGSRPPPGPTGLQMVMLLIIGALGLTAPFGTTICGAISISQIRHSCGRLYGLGLAIFDALLFPLLAADIAIGYFVGVDLRTRLIRAAPRPEIWMADIIPLVVAALLIVLLDVLVIRWAWRSAKRPVNGPKGPDSSAPPAEMPARPDAQPIRQIDSIQNARQAVKTPAIGLLIAASINLTFLLLLIGVVAIRIAAITSSGQGAITSGLAARPAQIPTATQFVMPFTFILLCLCVICVNGLIFSGAIRMMQLRNRGLAITAAILAMIAVPGNIIGLPMGIWALVVLSRREIAQAFASQVIPAQQAAPPTPPAP